MVRIGSELGVCDLFFRSELRCQRQNRPKEKRVPERPAIFEVGDGLLCENGSVQNPEVGREVLARIFLLSIHVRLGGAEIMCRKGQKYSSLRNVDLHRLYRSCLTSVWYAGYDHRICIKTMSTHAS